MPKVNASKKPIDTSPYSKGEGPPSRSIEGEPSISSVASTSQPRKTTRKRALRTLLAAPPPTPSTTPLPSTSSAPLPSTSAPSNTTPATTKPLRKPKVKKEEDKGKQKADIRKIDSKSKTTKKVKKTPIKLPPEAKMYLSESMRGRVLRAMKQKMFVLSREVFGDDTCEQFDVIGSIGNKYVVKIANKMSCTCLDYRTRTTHCKHILMVLLKVYRLETSNPMFQSLRTTAEQRINARSNGRKVDPSILLPSKLRQEILSYTEIQVEEPPRAEQRPLEGSACPICYEDLVNESEVVFCRTCGNNVHNECFRMWERSSQGEATCCICRSPWYIAPQYKTPKYLQRHDLTHEGGANFSAQLGLLRDRDTSTYKKNGRYAFE